MHFTKTLFLSASFLVAAIAQSPLSFTQVPSTIAAGEASVIEWTGGVSSGTITIELVQGDTSNPSSLSNISTIIQRNAQGTSFNWTVPDNLPVASNYALAISQGSSVSYSNQISVGSVGSGSSTSTVPPASTTYFSGLSTSTTLAPSASASSVSAAISSLAGVLSSISANGTAIVVSVTTTVGTVVSVGTGSPSTANATFVSQTLSATASSTGSTGTTGSSTSTSSSTSATSTSGASGLASSTVLLLSAIVAMVYLN